MTIQPKYQPDWQSSPNQTTHYHLDACQWFSVSKTGLWYVYDAGIWFRTNKPNSHKLIERPEWCEPLAVDGQDVEE